MLGLSPPKKNEGRQVPTDPRSQELARDQCGGAVEHPMQFWRSAGTADPVRQWPRPE